MENLSQGGLQFIALQPRYRVIAACAITVAVLTHMVAWDLSWDLLSRYALLNYCTGLVTAGAVVDLLLEAVSGIVPLKTRLLPRSFSGMYEFIGAVVMPVGANIIIWYFGFFPQAYAVGFIAGGCLAAWGGVSKLNRFSMPSGHLTPKH